MWQAQAEGGWPVVLDVNVCAACSACDEAGVCAAEFECVVVA